MTIISKALVLLLSGAFLAHSGVAYAQAATASDVSAPEVLPAVGVTPNTPAPAELTLDAFLTGNPQVILQTPDAELASLVQNLLMSAAAARKVTEAMTAIQVVALAASKTQIEEIAKGATRAADALVAAGDTESASIIQIGLASNTNLAAAAAAQSSVQTAAVTPVAPAPAAPGAGFGGDIGGAGAGGGVAGTSSGTQFGGDNGSGSSNSGTFSGASGATASGGASGGSASGGTTPQQTSTSPVTNS